MRMAHLTRLMNEIDLLYRSEAQFHIPVRMTVAQLVIDHLRSFDIVEPPMPTYPEYV